MLQMAKSFDIDKFTLPENFGRGTFLGNDASIDDLSPENRLIVSAWRHACPRRNEVSRKYGTEWTRQRYDECDFVFSSLIVEHSRNKPGLYQQLTASVKRLLGEPMGYHEDNTVPEFHKSEMSPLSTPWGYALPRIFIEQSGRGKERNWERYDKALDILDEAIYLSDTPIELLANLGKLAVDGDAKVDAVVNHIFEAGILDEENCRTMYNQIAEMIQQKAPKLWTYYSSLSIEKRRSEGLIENFPV